MSALAGLHIGVLLGGNSAERSVSLSSGAEVLTALQSTGANAIAIDPAEAGWIAQLGGLDFVFNILHGPGGEDGCIQGVCETLAVPYSGSGVAGAALTMDKINTKRIWLQQGLPTAPFALLDAASDWSALIEQFGSLFVKPAREGSSLGMTRVDSAQELQVAWQHAASYGHSVLAEQYIVGDEYTVAILGDRALPVIRIEPAAPFYDFDAKYVSDATSFHCPAGLAADDESQLADLAVQAFRAVGAEVWGRVDLIRDADRGWHLLEVNTVPGMTSHSLVPMAARAAGMSMPALLEAIWRESMEVRRHAVS